MCENSDFMNYIGFITNGTGELPDEKAPRYSDDYDDDDDSDDGSDED